MKDPLSAIEDRKANQDVGALAYQIYQGARNEGATRRDAMRVLTVWFRAAIAEGMDLEDSA